MVLDRRGEDLEERMLDFAARESPACFFNDRLEAYPTIACQPSAFSMALDKLCGGVAEENRLTKAPSRPTRNLVKFHLMLSVPRNPRAFDFKKT